MKFRAYKNKIVNIKNKDTQEMWLMLASKRRGYSPVLLEGQ